jgi:hypothetical protein
MTALPDLTGRWVGHYVQRDQRRQISADFRQQGVSLVGTMYDRTTEMSWPLLDQLGANGALSQQQREWLDSLLAALDDAPLSSIEGYFVRPQTAALMGELRDGHVSWQKQYNGPAQFGYRAGGRYVSKQVDDYVVNYQGSLSVDGFTIEGDWGIDARPDLGTPPRKGRFMLRRKPGHAEAAADSASTAVRADRAWWQLWHIKRK